MGSLGRIAWNSEDQLRRRYVIGTAAVGTIAVVLIAMVILNTTTYVAELQAFSRSPNSRELVVQAELRPGDSVLLHDVREHADRIVVAVRVRARLGSGPDAAISEPVTIMLREPLGTRKVVGPNGRPVPERR